jgi:hypothetical protein
MHIITMVEVYVFFSINFQTTQDYMLCCLMENDVFSELQMEGRWGFVWNFMTLHFSCPVEVFKWKAGYQTSRAWRTALPMELA